MYKKFLSYFWLDSMWFSIELAKAYVPFFFFSWFGKDLIFLHLLFFFLCSWVRVLFCSVWGFWYLIYILPELLMWWFCLTAIYKHFISWACLLTHFIMFWANAMSMLNLLTRKINSILLRYLEMGRIFWKFYSYWTSVKNVCRNTYVRSWCRFCFLGRKSDHDLEQRFSLSGREGKVELWEVSAELTLEAKSGSN